MISSIVSILVVVLVAALAAGAGFVARRESRNAAQARGDRDAAAERVEQVQQQLHDAVTETARLSEQVRHEQQHAERARAERDTATEQVAQVQRQLQDAAVEKGSLETQLAGERQRFAEQLALVRDAQEQMQQTVQRMAGEVLTQSGTQLIQRFTEMTQVSAQATAGEMDQRKAAFDAMVVPLRKELDKLQTQVRTFQETGAGAFSAVTEQMKVTNHTSEQLRKQAEHLATALRKPNTRGQWGELQLRTVVEAAGMIEHVDFQQQVHVAGADADGGRRPDMVVNLGGGRTIVVDAKTPFGAFLEAQEADTDAERAGRAAAHARNVRRHVDQLAAKQYWAQFSCTPEFVVMFLPADAFLQAALDHDPGLWDEAIRKKVILATPTNLLMSLRTVAYMWQQQALAVNADRIAELGGDLYQRITKVIVHLNAVGATLGKTVEAYDKTVRSFNSRLIPGARKMAELRRADETLEDLPAIERSVPTLAFPSPAGPDTETGGGARTA